MRKMLTASFLLVFVLFISHELMPQSSQSLDWQIQFLYGRARESMPIDEIIPMKTGDTFSLAVKADSDCYIYMLLYDSGRRIHLLENQVLTRGKEENFPDTSQFQLSEPSGTETIYVIVSLSRLENLERMIENNERNPNSRQHENNLFREVTGLQSSVSRLGEPATEIIPSGGTSRSVVDEKNFATKFTGKETYVRTITINH